MKSEFARPLAVRIEEPVWKTVGKWLERNETKIRGQENDSLVDFRQLYQS